MSRKKKLFFIITIILLFISLYFVYDLQLGAIPLLLLSILFFMLAYHNLPRKKDKDTKDDDKVKEKNGDNQI